jgi:hypothetical protein
VETISVLTWRVTTPNAPSEEDSAQRSPGTTGTGIETGPETPSWTWPRRMAMRPDGARRHPLRRLIAESCRAATSILSDP